MQQFTSREQFTFTFMIGRRAMARGIFNVQTNALAERPTKPVGSRGRLLEYAPLEFPGAFPGYAPLEFPAVGSCIWLVGSVSFRVQPCVLMQRQRAS